jgi:anti-sigma factor (TIGR02949 family)
MNPVDITNCEEALKVLAEHLDRELDEHRDAQLHAHLESCRSCYSRAEFERQLKAQIRTLSTDAVPDDLATRIKGLLNSFATA